MTDFLYRVDLASERLGGAVLLANDDFFAPKENLIKAEKPVFIEDKYTDRGKWMDGWETRRRRTPGHDWCILELGLPGIVRGVVVDTSFFRGNFPEQCSLEACALDCTPAPEEWAGTGIPWVEVLPKSPLKGDSENLFSIESPYRFTHLRLKIFPDGGVARLRVHGDVLPDWGRLLAAMESGPAPGGDLDLVAVEHGGRVVGASDMFFSAPQSLLMPGRGANMGDGWETRRRRGPGHDWVILQLGIEGAIRRVEADTAHFKGNYPESCSLEVCGALGATVEDLAGSAVAWKELLARTKLEADKQHFFEKELADAGPVTHARLNIFPDGGVSRLRLVGRPSREGRIRAGLERLNALLPAEAGSALRGCCGAERWVQEMVARRPFASLEQLCAAADQGCAGLQREDWLESFRSHPKIGENTAARQQTGQAGRWSGQEQAGVRGASGAIMAELAEANRAYEARFGYIFIVCATGKSSEEMLAILKQRMENNPETELRVAAEGQRKITRLRLEKLVTL